MNQANIRGGDIGIYVAQERQALMWPNDEPCDRGLLCLIRNVYKEISHFYNGGEVGMSRFVLLVFFNYSTIS